MSCNASARILGTVKSVVQKWVRIYKLHGENGLSKKHKHYSGIFKKNVIEYMHKNHLSMIQTAIEFQIPSDSLIGRWERIYYEEGLVGLMKENRGRKNKKIIKNTKKIENQSYDELLIEVKRLKMENEYLKKLQALVQERTNPKNKK